MLYILGRLLHYLLGLAVSFHFAEFQLAKFQFAEFQLPVGSGLGIWLGSGIGLWIGIGLVLKFGELNDDDEPDAQKAARSIGVVALYAKAKEPQEFGEM